MKKLLLILLLVLFSGSCKKDATTETPPFVVADYPIELVGEWMPIAEKFDGEWAYRNDYDYFFSFEELKKFEQDIYGFGFFYCRSTFFQSTYGAYYFESDNIYVMHYKPEDGKIDSIQKWHLVSLKNDTLHVGQITENRRNEYLYLYLNPSSE